VFLVLGLAFASLRFFCAAVWLCFSLCIFVYMDPICVVVRSRGDHAVVLDRSAAPTLRDLISICCVDSTDVNLCLTTPDGDQLADSPDDLLPASGEKFFLYGDVDDAALEKQRSATQSEDTITSPAVDESALPKLLRRDERKGREWDAARVELSRFVFPNPNVAVVGISLFLSIVILGSRTPCLLFFVASLVLACQQPFRFWCFFVVRDLEITSVSFWTFLSFVILRSRVLVFGHFCCS
jgi:hypothetical protein